MIKEEEEVVSSEAAILREMIIIETKMMIEPENLIIMDIRETTTIIILEERIRDTEIASMVIMMMTRSPLIKIIMMTLVKDLLIIKIDLRIKKMISSTIIGIIKKETITISIMRIRIILILMKIVI